MNGVSSESTEPSEDTVSADTISTRDGHPVQCNL